MTDRELNYQGMALNVLKLLRDARPTWEKLYQKMLPDYLALETALSSLDDKAQLRSGSSSAGYTDAKDLAEIAVLDAAMPVVQGLRALYQDGGHPDLAKVAAYSRTSLDALRGLVQVQVLEGIYSAAQPLAADLAGEMVTADQLQTLHNRTATYKPLIGTPRQQTTAGSVLREAAVQHLGEARAALAKLDVRVPNLRAALPDLVAAYEKARLIVDAGHSPQPDAGTPPPTE